MDKKLYIQPSFREVITQLDSYMDIIQASTEEEQFPIGEGDGEDRNPTTSIFESYRHRVRAVPRGHIRDDGAVQDTHHHDRHHGHVLHRCGHCVVAHVHLHIRGHHRSHPDGLFD